MCIKVKKLLNRHLYQKDFGQDTINKSFISKTIEGI